LTIASILSGITANDFEEVDAKANITIPSATFTGLVTSFADVRGLANTTLDTTLLSSSANISTPTAVVFNFNKDAYDRSRVIHILSQGSSSSNSTTVHIKPESRSVYIEYRENNNTVYIAA
jgi:hypothetical protein